MCQAPILLRHHPGAVSLRSVAIASRLGHIKLRAKLSTNPATRRHQCRCRKFDFAALMSEYGGAGARTRNLLANFHDDDPGSSANPCLNRTRPFVLRVRLTVHPTSDHSLQSWAVIHDESHKRHRDGSSPPPGLEAASHPASQLHLASQIDLASQT